MDKFSTFMTILVMQLGLGLSAPNVANITMKKCGTSKVMVINGDRIVGGRAAVEGEIPWQVSLRFKNWYISPTHMCGATILNPRWIITAAHCVDGRLAENYEVAVGIFSQDAVGKYQASYEVEQIISHEKFERKTFKNDIALLKLKKPILFARSRGYINGVCLPKRNSTVTGMGSTSGWGSTEEGGDGTDVLQTVELPILPHVLCEILFGGSDSDIITDKMLCAGELEGGVDTCQGDSGGPLIQRNADGKAVLVGIVSWGVGCARPRLPGVYTAVAAYIDWIYDHVR